MDNSRVIRLKKAFDKIHEGLSEIRLELVLESDDVQDIIEQAEMVLSPIRKLRLYYGVPYGHEEEEKGEREDVEKERDDDC